MDNLPACMPELIQVNCFVSRYILYCDAEEEEQDEEEPVLIIVVHMMQFYRLTFIHRSGLMNVIS